MRSHYDIAIIGMGPVGVTLAKLLAGFGVEVLAVDSAEDIYDRPRAIGMDHEVMRVFQQIGVAADLAPFISDYRASEYRTASGEVIRRFTSPSQPFPLGWAPYQTFLQPELERVLRRHASNDPKITMRTGCEMVSIKTDGAKATLRLRDVAEDAHHMVTARYVVGCDGGGSPVRKSMGIAFEDLIFDEPWVVVDALVDDDVDLPDVNIQYCDPARPHTFVVGPKNLRRWEFMLMPGEAPENMTSDVAVWRLLSPWVAPDNARLWRAAAYRFHALVAERWRRGNIFLAGDACHMTPPFLAQGMVQGIKDAANLAWKLDAVLKGADNALLDSYEEERRPLVRDVISITKDLGRIIGETEPAKAALRNEKMRADMADGRGETVRQDLFPPIGASICRLRTGSTSTAEGFAAPQPRVAGSAGWQLLDEVTGARWAILARDTFDVPVSTRKRAEAIGIMILSIGPNGLAEEHGVFERWMTAKNANAILTRPDHMVMAGAATATELNEALDAVQSLFPETNEVSHA
jgi:3-(3-hydroxy-phenyl)propionate hydroxylase